MMYFKRLILTITLSMLAWQVHAVTPFVKGSFTEIQNTYQDDDYLVVFWGQDCAYCMKELAEIGHILKLNPHIKLITVATDPFLDKAFIEDKMAEFGLTQADHWFFASDYPETLYFDVNKRWRGELPLTYLSQADEPIFKRGLLTPEDMQQWLDSLR